MSRSSFAGDRNGIAIPERRVRICGVLVGLHLLVLLLKTSQFRLVNG